MNSLKLTDVDPGQYQALTDAPPELVADILSAAHFAYEACVASPGGQAAGLTYPDARKSRHCMPVAKDISAYLGSLEKGYTADILSVQFPSAVEGDDRRTFHAVSTVSVSGDSSDRVFVADAAWQQFLPDRHLNLKGRLKDVLGRNTYPPVFIGRPTEIARVALGVGFSEKQSLTWTPGQS